MRLASPKVIKGKYSPEDQDKHDKGHGHPNRARTSLSKLVNERGNRTARDHLMAPMPPGAGHLPRCEAEQTQGSQDRDDQDHIQGDYRAADHSGDFSVLDLGPVADTLPEVSERMVNGGGRVVPYLLGSTAPLAPCHTPNATRWFP